MKSTSPSNYVVNSGGECWYWVCNRSCLPFGSRLRSATSHATVMMAEADRAGRTNALTASESLDMRIYVVMAVHGRNVRFSSSGDRTPSIVATVRWRAKTHPSFETFTEHVKRAGQYTSQSN